MGQGTAWGPQQKLRWKLTNNVSIPSLGLKDGTPLKKKSWGSGTEVTGTRLYKHGRVKTSKLGGKIQAPKKSENGGWNGKAPPKNGTEGKKDLAKSNWDHKPDSIGIKLQNGNNRRGGGEKKRPLRTREMAKRVWETKEGECMRKRVGKLLLKKGPRKTVEGVQH